jgi:hypothetical protein
MPDFKYSDTKDSLSREQLEFLSETDSDFVIRFLKSETRFDENQIRLLCDMGRAEATRRLAKL